MLYYIICEYVLYINIYININIFNTFYIKSIF